MSSQICANGGTAVYADVENALNPSLKDGVDVSKFEGKNFAHHPIRTWVHLEEIMDKYLDLADIIVVDSITSVLPQKILEESVESIQPGIQARMQSTFFQKYKGAVAESKTCLFLINQARVKFDFANPSNTCIAGAGGFALKHYCDLRFLGKKVGLVYENPADKHEGEEIGAQVALVSIKNKVRGINKGLYTIIFGKGVDEIRSVADLFKVSDAVTAAGSYFKISLKGKEQNVQGNKGLFNFIVNNKKMVEEYLKSQEMIN
jgi:RecA/RadA recombinase